MTAVHACFKDVEKTYDGKTLVVNRLNLEVMEGEFLTMLGPSGSGKTTCLMMLAGFETITHGNIYLRDRVISQIPPHKRGIGMVFQNYALFPHMTIRENLAFPLQVRKMPAHEIDGKIKRALDMVQLQDFVTRYPAQLSGGQQQRVAVARALVFEPDLVLMDEPLGALDKNLREQMQYELKHIHENLGITVVYVTHDQSEALTMSNRVAVFNEGVVQQLASPDELYECPQNAFVAQFIGENNKLMGTVESIDNGFCTVRAGENVVQARAVRAQQSKPTTLSLRPERVCILPSGESNGLPNCFEAVLKEQIYLGDHLRLRVALWDSAEFIIKVPNNRAHAHFSVNDTIRVGWSKEDCHALDVA